jgi:hypothetical protein
MQDLFARTDDGPGYHSGLLPTADVEVEARYVDGTEHRMSMSLSVPVQGYAFSRTRRAWEGQWLTETSVREEGWLGSIGMRYHIPIASLDFGKTTETGMGADIAAATQTAKEDEVLFLTLGYQITGLSYETTSTKRWPDAARRTPAVSKSDGFGVLNRFTFGFRGKTTLPWWGLEVPFNLDLAPQGVGLNLPDNKGLHFVRLNPIYFNATVGLRWWFNSWGSAQLGYRLQTHSISPACLSHGPTLGVSFRF